MVDLIVVGSIALDDIKTPLGEVKNVLGGTATYFSFAASLFAKVGVVAVVGNDFDDKHITLLKDRGVCLDGLRVKDGKTFKWKGLYEKDMNQAQTLSTELNVFSSFCPNIPESYKKTDYVFLGNIGPELQINVLKQIEKPKLVALDTMNLWIKNEKEKLKLIEAIKMVDVLFINEWEARQLFETPKLIEAAQRALEMGPKHIVIKKGEHGAMLFSKSSCFFAPAYPLETLTDPTGAGDSFAGGFMGWMAKTKDLSEKNMRKAVIYGSVVASFNAEGFSLNNLKKIKIEDVEKRFKEFKEMVDF